MFFLFWFTYTAHKKANKPQTCQAVNNFHGAVKLTLNSCGITITDKHLRFPGSSWGQKWIIFDGSSN
ncbi:MAG: hypothetical protein C4330_01685 [Chitinophagaceae bacterium]